MTKASKSNPYQCPECVYKTSRKSSIKRHIEGVHHLKPIIPGPDKNEWIFTQLKHCAESLVRAERDGDKEKAQQDWDSMIGIWKNHQDIMTEKKLFEYKERARQELKILSG